MKKFAIVLILFMIMLSSCSNRNVIENETASPVSDKTLKENGYSYVLNTNTRTCHTWFCTYAINMKEEYRQECKDTEFIRSRNYKSCELCLAGMEPI